MSETQPVRPEDISLYRGVDNLPPALWDDLTALAPMVVARQAGVRYEPGQGFLVPFLGADYLVNPDKKTIIASPGARPPGFQSGLVLLNYLVHAKEDGLAGRMVSERELNGGELFFKGPHALNKAPVLERYSRDAKGLLAQATAMGGMPLNSGDAAFRLSALPKVLVAYVLYLEDEEFPAGLTITFDEYTDRHLPLDSIWALINVISHRLSA